MPRAPRKLSSLTQSSNSQLERQARRISRQQKQLNKELMNEFVPVKLVGATGRAIRKSDIKKIDALTDTQEDFFDVWSDDSVQGIVLYGSAGTGKTFLALHHALEEILTEEPMYDRIILVRSFVPSRETGFLPGTLEEKGEIYELPFSEVVFELTGKKEAYTKLKESGKIEFHSSSYLRGLTFNRSIVIVDESQNMSWGEISTVMTRMGETSRIVFCCDLAQNDLVHKKNDVSGLRDFLTVTKNMSEFRHIKFTPEDIVRSGIVKSFIVNCEKFGL